MLPSHKFFSDASGRRNQNPSFEALDTCIPGWGSKRILMNLRPWSLWANQEPSVRWHLILLQELEQVVFEVLWGLVILLHHVSLRMLFQAAFKEVKWGIVSTIQSIFEILLQCYFDFSPWVALSYLELGLPEALQKWCHSPCVISWPIISYPLYYYWHWAILKSFQKFSLGEVCIGNSLNGVSKFIKSNPKPLLTTFQNILGNKEGFV